MHFHKDFFHKDFPPNFLLLNDYCQFIKEASSKQLASSKSNAKAKNASQHAKLPKVVKKSRSASNSGNSDASLNEFKSSKLSKTNAKESKSKNKEKEKEKESKASKKKVTLESKPSKIKTTSTKDSKEKEKDKEKNR